MKTLRLTLSFLLLSAFVSNASATSLTFLGSIDGLSPSNPPTELAWLKTLPGVPDTTVFLNKFEDGSDPDGPFAGDSIDWAGDDKSGSVTYSGSLDSLYMILKYGQLRDAYLVTDIQSMSGMIPWPPTGEISKGISHISFFDGGDTPEIPTPSSLVMLVSLGLTCAGLLRLKRGA